MMIEAAVASVLVVIFFWFLAYVFVLKMFPMRFNLLVLLVAFLTFGLFFYFSFQSMFSAVSTRMKENIQKLEQTLDKSVQNFLEPRQGMAYNFGGQGNESSDASSGTLFNYHRFKQQEQLAE